MILSPKIRIRPSRPSIVIWDHPKIIGMHSKSSLGMIKLINHKIPKFHHPKFVWSPIWLKINMRNPSNSSLTHGLTS